MPLVTCPDCERQVSTRATRCPGCGSPVEAPAPQHKPTSAPIPADRTSKHQLLSERSTQRFYSAGQIRAAAFFGSILCAAHLIATNWRRLGRPEASSSVWVASFGLFAVIFVVGQLMPDKAAAQVGLASTIFYIALADRFHKKQGEAIATRMAEGATAASGWLVAAISLAYGAVVIALVLGLSFFL